MLAFLKKHFLTTRILKFSAVGATGIAVNTGFLLLFKEILKLDYKVASLLAIEISILTNFLLNDIWTWRDRDKQPLARRLIRYHISTGMTALVFNWATLILLTDVFKVWYLISNLVGIAFGTVSNYLLHTLWTFKEQPKLARRPARDAESGFRKKLETFLSADGFLIFLSIVIFIWWNKHDRTFFMDPLIYTTLAKNLAQGWNFWNFHFTDYSMTVFFQHAPLLVWSQALVFKVFGFSPFTAHLVPLTASTITVLAVYRLAVLIKDRWTGLLAVLVLLLSPLFLKMGTSPYIESLLTMCVTLTILFYVKAVLSGPRWLIAAALSTGFGFLSQGPLIAGVVFVLLLDVLVNRRFKLVLNWTGLAAAGVFLLVAAVWIVPDLALNRGAWISHYFGSRLRDAFAGHAGKPEFLYLTGLLFTYQPHVMVPFLVALYTMVRNLFRERFNLLLTAWFVVYVVILSLVKGQLSQYVHPVYPVISLITALFLAGLLQRWQARIRFYLKAFLIFGAAVLLVATTGPDEFRYRDVMPIVDYLKGFAKTDYQIFIVKKGQHPWAAEGLFKTYASRDLRQAVSVESVLAASRPAGQPVFIVLPAEEYASVRNSKKFRVLLGTTKYLLVLYDPLDRPDLFPLY